MPTRPNGCVRSSGRTYERMRMIRITQTLNVRRSSYQQLVTSLTMSPRDTLNTFTLETIPGLEVAVLGALELFEETAPPSLTPLTGLTRPLVLGSENALATGRILFSDRDARYADEGVYIEALAASHTYDSVVLVSASGGKHARIIAESLSGDVARSAWLLTNNPKAPAAQFLSPDHVLLFPKNREPYTYNTSTYLGMILAKTRESPRVIREYIEKEVMPALLPWPEGYSAYSILFPARFEALVPMVRTKFDELFGPKLVLRAFTVEQAKHAKTVVSSEEELFISIGENNAPFGGTHRRLFVPTPEDAREGAVMAIAYTLVGMLARAYPPYFALNITGYCTAASRIFNEPIEPIVVESRE